MSEDNSALFEHLEHEVFEQMWNEVRLSSPAFTVRFMLQSDAGETTAVLIPLIFPDEEMAHEYMHQLVHHGAGGFIFANWVNTGRINLPDNGENAWLPIAAHVVELGVTRHCGQEPTRLDG